MNKKYSYKLSDEDSHTLTGMLTHGIDPKDKNKDVIFYAAGKQVAYIPNIQGYSSFKRGDIKILSLIDSIGETKEYKLNELDCVSWGSTDIYVSTLEQIQRNIAAEKQEKENYISTIKRLEEKNKVLEETINQLDNDFAAANNIINKLYNVIVLGEATLLQNLSELETAQEIKSNIILSHHLGMLDQLKNKKQKGKKNERK